MSGIDRGGPADRAGMRPLDRIRKVNGHVTNDVEDAQRRRLARLRAERDNARAAACLDALRQAGENDHNVIGPMLDCARAYCTLFEIREALERVYGAYREPVFF